MRIRTQTILVITPIFAALGVAIGLLVYASERSEVIWGIEEEASSLGISMAEFVDTDRFFQEMKNSEGFSQGNRLKSILSYGQLKQVRLYVLDGSDFDLAWNSGEKEFEPEGEPSETELATAVGEGFFLSPIQELESGESIVRALVPLVGADGRAVGLLEAVTDAGRLKTSSEQIVLRCANMTVALAGVGILLSIGVSGFLTRRLRRLDEAARIVASGDYDQKINLRTIQEVNDLGSTFNTMSSVLRNLLSRAKKELVEAEQFRNPVDLAATCRELHESGVRREFGRYELLMRTAGDFPSGDFTGIYEGDASTCFILGRVLEEDPLEATIKANAALFFIQKLLAAGSPAESLERAGRVFDFEVCAILEHREGESLNCFQVPEDFLPEDSVEFSRDVPVVATTARPVVAGKIWRFIESTGNISDHELELLLEGEPLSAFLIIQVCA